MVVTVRAASWWHRGGAYVVALDDGRVLVAPLLLDRPLPGARLSVEGGRVTLARGEEGVTVAKGG